jgi:hypothetical protein
MPYAAKATIEYEFVTDYLDLYVTFKKPMRRSYDPLHDPPVYDVMPPLSLWSLTVDGGVITIIASEWLDEWTLLLTSNTVAGRPTEVKLAYLGPNIDLQTTWRKQWEPFGPIVCVDYTATFLPAGVLMLWHGSVATIPSGWLLCDGTNGTPDLRDEYVIGAGGSYDPGDSVGSADHTHAATQAEHSHAATQLGHTHTTIVTVSCGLGTGNKIVNSSPSGNFDIGSSGGGGGTSDSKTPVISVPNATPSITVPNASNLPPSKAYCWIMKV